MARYFKRKKKENNNDKLADLELRAIEKAEGPRLCKHPCTDHILMWVIKGKGMFS